MSDDGYLIVGGIVIGGIVGYAIVLLPLTLLLGSDVSKLPSWCYWVAGLLGLLIGVIMAFLFTVFVYKIGFTLFWLTFIFTNTPKNDIETGFLVILALLGLLWIWFPPLFALIIKIFTALITAFIGAGLLVYLIQLDMQLWISAVGFACLIVGIILADISRKTASPIWSLNALEAYLLGVIMIIAGVFTFFIHRS